MAARKGREASVAGVHERGCACPMSTCRCMRVHRASVTMGLTSLLESSCKRLTLVSEHSQSVLLPDPLAPPAVAGAV